MSKKLLDIELTEGITSVRGMSNYDAAHLLVRYRGRPLDWVVLPNKNQQSTIPLDLIRDAITNQLGDRLLWAVLGNFDINRSDMLHFQKPISVVVCTHNRPDQLRTCLESLMMVDYSCFEIVVVDNAPSDNQTNQLVTNYPVRYVREDQPGLARARNCGISNAQYDLIAFTDDDVVVDRFWLQALDHSFYDPEVMAVTGLVVPLELQTEAQLLHEFGYGGMMGNLDRKYFRGKQVPLRDLLWASSMGVGANMAFRRQLFIAVGEFDSALGVGTPSRGGEDTEILNRLVSAGYTLQYEPQAIVRHRHRRDMRALSGQLHDNGAGFGSYLLTCARKGSVDSVSVLSFAFRDWLGWWLIRRLLRPHSFPRRLILSELWGALTSPFHYLAAHYLK